uniref:DGQHR domain-containing protein n=1 Tax=Roseihalotalea indica TaxID=2867963 RepID=A0AA49GHU3_9BACT|nr:DGQHR domain-containing protein [Tunicatimonas sp. TK19036]
MSQIGDIKRLKSSWTKYDCVQVIEIIGDDELDFYLKGEKDINAAVLCNYLGIKSFDDPVPDYWINIQKFPDQKRLFTLAAGIFTHYENIRMFSEDFSNSSMVGTFKVGEGGKHKTNLRSALVVSGAAKNSDRRKDIVPYDLSALFDEGEVGLYFKKLLVERLSRVGYGDKHLNENFFSICLELNFHKVFSLNKIQFKRWLEGKRITKIRGFSYDLKEILPDQEINAFKVKQWLEPWNNIDFSQSMRRKPDPHFYIFKIDIRILKRLSEVHRRKANKARISDTSVQRGHDEKRSYEIKRYVEGGYPWSTMSDADRKSPENENFRMPGILPTAIVANILGKGQKRGNSEINEEDLIHIEDESNLSKFVLPRNIFDEKWDPELKPIEIIDGQHRLMAFDETEEFDGDYEVPVVAYYNLDRAWQAYLFYVINIKPKKINTSLGYDLYPLLRTQDWLENSKEGLAVYRETRAQELVEALWLYEQSPWRNRINMLGVSQGGNISQAAFIRALTSSYLKRASRKPIGGLFTDTLSGKNFEEIKWVRAQQAGFLILLWEQIALEASRSEEEWALKLRNEKKQIVLFDALDRKNSALQINDAFLSKNSMLSRDQGVTGISMFTNDLFFVAANYFNDFDFNSIEWKGDIDERQIEVNSLDKAIDQFRGSPLHSLIKDIAEVICMFDWRTSSAEFDNFTKQEIQKKYKGSGGYREVWKDLFSLFKQSSHPYLSKYASKLEELS